MVKEHSQSWRRDEMRRRFEAGERQQDIAAAMGVSAAAVAKGLRSRGIPTRFARGRTFRLVNGSVQHTLPSGQVMKFDLIDRDLIESSLWHMNGGRVVRSGLYEGDNNLARLILGVSPDVLVDHVNGDWLDNRRANLRSATRRENLQNRRKQSALTSSLFKGVTKSSPTRWIAYISLQSGRRLKTSFKSEIDAARQYDDWARQYFGEFACVNFPKVGERGALCEMAA